MIQKKASLLGVPKSRRKTGDVWWPHHPGLLIPKGLTVNLHLSISAFAQGRWPCEKVGKQKGEVNVSFNKPRNGEVLRRFKI